MIFKGLFICQVAFRAVRFINYSTKLSPMLLTAEPPVNEAGHPIVTILDRGVQRSVWEFTIEASSTKRNECSKRRREEILPENRSRPGPERGANPDGSGGGKIPGTAVRIWSLFN